MFELRLSYPLLSDWRETQEVIEKIVKAYRGKNLGSGTDFKTRDLAFEFKSKINAGYAKAEIENLGIEGIEFYP